MRDPIRKRAVYSRITVRLPTFAILMLRRFAERRNEKDGGAETVSTVLESWILALFSTREIAKAGKESPEFRPAIEAWLRWEAQERARRQSPTRAKRS